MPSKQLIVCDTCGRAQERYRYLLSIQEPDNIMSTCKKCYAATLRKEAKPEIVKAGYQTCSQCKQNWPTSYYGHRRKQCKSCQNKVNQARLRRLGRRPMRKKVTDEGVWCGICQQRLPANNFGWCWRDNQYNSHCRACKNAIARQKYAARRTKVS